ncbi:hypothetical protein GCM10022384_03540 [Streptomyces marokkonensis]|uniref:Secreted protein n=1 Tax=Streptomyces marokkonensis TaxID=324855 RepID=A0ABP7NSN1_9ACTN
MTRRRRIAGLLAGASLATGAMLATAVPAQAYSPDPRVQPIPYDTDTCPCSHPDPHDGTYFKHDPGGVAMKIHLDVNRGTWIGKVEFHPHDELLWVYDTRDDGDTYYVTVSYYNEAGRKVRVGGVMSAGTSSAAVDSRTYDLDITDGRRLVIDLYDDSGLTDHITAVSNAVA